MTRGARREVPIRSARAKVGSALRLGPARGLGAQRSGSGGPVAPAGKLGLSHRGRSEGRRPRRHRENPARMQSGLGTSWGLAGRESRCRGAAVPAAGAVGWAQVRRRRLSRVSAGKWD